MDWLYLVLTIPGVLLALYATYKTRSTFDHYSRTAASSGLTGAEAARRLLAREGIHDVEVEQVQGFLSDHYDPTSRTLRLSPPVYQSQSLSAVGVACHEAGHALQHAGGYAWLGMRTAMVPVTQFGSIGTYVIVLLGMFMHHPKLYLFAALLFSAVVLFSLITLPVEWNASARAKRLMVSAGIVSPVEQEDAARVLNAAFLTYLASAISSLLTLLFYLIRAGAFGGSRKD